MSIESSSFYSGSLNLYFPITVITGVCRSGKTLLGNLLATCPRVEYADEPWTAMLLPAMSCTGKMQKDFASEMFQTYCCELFNDLVLLRKANFRMTDLSSIWTKKDPQEIFHRLSQLHSREAVISYAKSQRLMLLLTLSESLPFVDFFCDSIKNIRLIYVVRNGFEVAFETRNKKWFSDEHLLKPQGANLYTLNQSGNSTWYLPWWVDDGDESYFLSLSEYGRGLYYWCSLNEKGLDAFNRCYHDTLTVKYSDLVVSPATELERARNFLDLPTGMLTLSEISKIRNSISYDLDLSLVDKELKKRVLCLHEKMEIDWHG